MFTQKAVISSLLLFTTMVCHGSDYDNIINDQVKPSLSKVDKSIKLGTFADKEIGCLAQNLYYEARNQPDAGIIGIGFVVKTRVNRKRWPNTMCEVIWQHRVIRGKKRAQFSWTVDGLSDTPNEKKAWAKAKRFAKLIYNNKVENPVGKADHYYADYINPYWALTMFKTATLGNHHFMDSTIKVEVASVR